MIENYKSIKDLSLPLNRLNVLIGSNGAGKSNFISFFELTKAIYEQRFGSYTLSKGGIDNLLRQGRKVSPSIQGLIDFDNALFGHIAFTIRHCLRAFRKGLTGSHFVSVPDQVAPETRRYYQQLTRFSSAFAFLADISMLVMGGELKRREKLSARLGDILAMMYLCSATLKRYESEGRQAEDAPLMHWAIWDMR